MFTGFLHQTSRSRTVRRRPCFSVLAAVAGALAMLASIPALAEDDARTPSVTGDMKAARLEVSASSMPRFDNVDGATSDSRIGITLLPQRGSGLGLSLGMTSAAQPAFNSLPPSASASPQVDVGVHWRYTDDNLRFDVTAYRRVSSPEAISLVQNRDPAYGARVEMRMGTVSSKGFVADKGFVGFQLESGARITVKRSRGVPMFYYRNSF